MAVLHDTEGVQIYGLVRLLLDRFLDQFQSMDRVALIDRAGGQAPGTIIHCLGIERLKLERFVPVRLGEIGLPQGLVALRSEFVQLWILGEPLNHGRVVTAGFFVAFDCRQGISTIVPAERMAGIGGQGGIEACKRLFDPIQFQIGRRAIAEGLDEVGLGRQSALETGERFDVTPETQQRNAANALDDLGRQCRLMQMTSG